jgi:hypothetical protein
MESLVEEGQKDIGNENPIWRAAAEQERGEPTL